MRTSHQLKRRCAASQKKRQRGRGIWVPRAAFGRGPMDLRGGRARDLCTSKGPRSCCPSLTTAAPTPREKGEGHQGSKSWSLDPTGTRNNKSSPA